MTRRAESCESCYFYEEKNGPGGHSECHRYAPRPTTDPPGHIETDNERASEGLVMWPVVLPEDWCGEYRSQGDA